MIYKRYYLQVIFRVIGIVITSLILVYLFLSARSITATVGVFGLLVYQTFVLIQYLNKTNQYLSNFLLSLKETDGNFVFHQAENYSPISDLHTYFTEIREIIRHVKIEEEKQYHYIQYIIENVGVGIISFDAEGKIELSNQTARNLLRLPVLYNVRDLGRVSDGMDRIVRSLKPEKPMLYRLNLGDEILHLSLKASYFKIDAKPITLVSFQDIRNALEDRELESWQKLIRVLTHEIMNSITPINTLTKTLKKIFQEEKQIKSAKEIDDELIQEAVNGLNLIDDRAKGLTGFVKKYRSLTRLPKPNFNEVNVNQLFDKIILLFSSDIHECGVQVKLDIKEQINLFADEALIEQVIINLFKNALQAVNIHPEPVIQLQAYLDSSGKITLVVKDNGAGISDDIINHIFIPFFTTKDGGSGIGLSLSRQIMRLHKGSISVQSKVGEGTKFFLKF